jgi:hypothetical protein
LIGVDRESAGLDRGILADGPSSSIGTTVTLAVVGGLVVHRSEASP